VESSLFFIKSSREKREKKRKGELKQEKKKEIEKERKSPTSRSEAFQKKNDILCHVGVAGGGETILRHRIVSEVDHTGGDVRTKQRGRVATKN